MDLLNYFVDKKVGQIADSDCDGIGSRIIAEWYIKSKCKEYKCLNTADRSMKEVPEDFYNDLDVVLFTDITPPTLEYYNKLVEKNIVVIIADHHETGRIILGDLPNYYFTTEKCGTKIFFDTIMEKKRRSNIIQEFVHLTDIYDRYITDHEDWNKAKGLNHVLYGMVNWIDKSLTDTEKHKKFVETNLQKFNNYPNNNYFFTPYEKTLIEKANKKEMDNYLEAKKNLRIRKDDSGNNYGYTECSSKVSLVSHRLLTDLKDKVDYLVMHGTWLEKVKHDYNGKVSLRSKAGFDVRPIAEKHGGGGHPQASGVDLSLEVFNQLKIGKIHLI